MELPEENQVQTFLQLLNNLLNILKPFFVRCEGVSDSLPPPNKIQKHKPSTTKIRGDISQLCVYRQCQQNLKNILAQNFISVDIGKGDH
jgi:hypothetical protein